MHIFTLDVFGFHIGPTWYGLMYALGFIICYFFVKKHFIFRENPDLDTLLTYIFFGVIGGGRIGYILFYNPLFFWTHPWSMIAIWEGGMSFHGGLIGVILSVWLFCRKYGYQFWNLIDTLAIIIPIALGLGRLGNWINGELPGYKPYDGPLAMIVDGTPHFPSPLLQMFLEGCTLLACMFYFWRYSTRRWGGYQKIPGLMSGIFLIGYGIMRLISEQFRLPDIQIGYVLGTDFLTMGMIYSVPMVIFGGYLIWRSLKT